MKATLDLTKLGLTLSGTNYSQDTNELGRYMVHRLTTYLASEHQDPFVYETPKSWWQMFKSRYFPMWLLKRFPAQFNRHELTVKTLYPKLKSKLPLDLMGPYVQVIVQDKVIGSFLTDTEGLTPLDFNREAHEKLMRISRLDGKICPCCHRSWFYDSNS